MTQKFNQTSVCHGSCFDTNLATTCSLLTTNQTAFDFVIDFLRVFHQHPPSQGVSLLEFCQYMWRQIVVKIGFLRGDDMVTTVIDKPEFLPPLGNYFIQ